MEWLGGAVDVSIELATSKLEDGNGETIGETKGEVDDIEAIDGEWSIRTEWIEDWGI